MLRPSRRRAWLAALVVVLAGALLAGTPARPAVADDSGGSATPARFRDPEVDTTTVGVRLAADVVDLALDEPRGRLYLAHREGIAVVSLEGDRLEPMDSFPGRVRAITLSADGDHLYVTAGTSFVVVDLSGDGAQQSFDLGGTSCPEGVAETRGLAVVVVRSCRDEAELVLVDPDTGPVTRFADVPSYATAVATSPGRPGTVLVASFDDVARVEVAEGPEHEMTAVARRPVRMGKSAALELTPDGEHLLASDGILRSTADLAAERTVFGGDGPFGISTGSATAGALRDGRLVSVGLDDGLEIGREPLARRYLRGGGRHLVFGDDAMYALTGGDDNQWWLTRALPRRSVNLRVRTSSRRYGFHDAVSVRVAGLPARLPARASFDAFGPVPAREVWSGTAGRDGVVTLSPRATRSGRLTVSVAGDDTYQADVERVVYRVGARITGRALDPLRRDGRYAVYRRGDRAVVLSTVAPDHTGDCVKLEAEFLVRGRWRGRPGECVRLGDGSRLSAYLDGRAQYVGIPIRVRTLMNVADNLPSRSAWTYLRFVGAGGRVGPSHQPDDLLLEVL